jgi:lambda repressor-like predicted transcriptional regulator
MNKPSSQIWHRLALLCALTLIGLSLRAPSRWAQAQGQNKAFQAAGAPASGGIAACPLFPASNVWNTPVDNLPVDPHSADYINAILPADKGLHPDFGSGTWQGQPIGIPYNIVTSAVPGVSVTFYYDDQSDHVLYPIPPNPLIEGGSDRHILIVDRDRCLLYELFDASLSSGQWSAGSGAFFALHSNDLRPDAWTSADAAGLPMLPGLARYDEVAAGAITHALRFTLNKTRNEHIWPARHDASDHPDIIYPPMGQRFRLKASYQIPANFSPQTRVILQALKTYGMILADNGSDWYISGAPDPGWDNDSLVSELYQVKGSDFEAVDESSLMVDPNSGVVKTYTPPPPRSWLPVLR